MNSINIALLGTLLFGHMAFADSADTEASTLKTASSNEEIAKKLANPVSAMITLPFQLNYERGFYGTSGQKSNRWTLNIQPVVPFELNDEWKIVSRTILPVIRMDNIPVGNGITGGVGDIVQSVFLSPKKPTENGWIWGAGAVMMIPSDSDVSSKKWGLGPTAVALRQKDAWTYGALVNHIWSVGGSDSVVKKVNNTFVQPFVTYTTSAGLSISAMSETTYNWEATSENRWTVPLFFSLGQTDTIGKQRISYGASLKYNVKSPIGGAEGWGARLFFTFVFPK